MTDQTAYWFARLDNEWKLAVKAKNVTTIAALADDANALKVGKKADLAAKAVTAATNGALEPAKAYNTDLTSLKAALKAARAKFKDWLDLDKPSSDYVSSSYSTGT